VKKKELLERALDIQQVVSARAICTRYSPSFYSQSSYFIFPSFLPNHPIYAFCCLFFYLLFSHRFLRAAFSFGLQNYFGEEHPEVAAVLVNLGNAHGALGDATKKKELLVKALRIQEEAASKSRIGGKDCSDVTRTMVSTIVNLGNVWGDLGDSSLKKQFLERALGLQEALLKEKSSPATFLELATILHNLGAAYGDTGDFWKQRDALERALRIKETQVMHRTFTRALFAHATHTVQLLPVCGLLKELLLQFGPEHFELAKTLANLGLAYAALYNTTGFDYFLIMNMQVR
jgi:tetratricopeptide (TPR) repeat protein